MIQHFLITRFNCLYPWRTETPSEAWLRERVKLFERFCYPSVTGQDCQNFIWVMFFDVNTPAFLREKIKEWSVFPNLRPDFIPIYSDQHCADIVKQLSPPGAHAVALTRMDNDDAITRGYVRMIQAAFEPVGSEPYVINANLGYLWHEERIYFKPERDNPFMTLVESMDKVTTPNAYNHTKIRDHFRVVELESERGWLQVQHGDNTLINVPKRKYLVRVRKSSLREQFVPNVLGENDSGIEYLLDKAGEIARRLR